MLNRIPALASLLFLPSFSAPIMATAQAPASTLITSCVSNLTRLTRIVASPANCTAGVETVVQWNQQGPAGVAGPQGSVGPMGVPGAIGPQGTAGATGAPGLRYVGIWSPFGNWKKNDVVSFRGSSYVAVVDDPVGVFQPSSKQGAAIWNILAAQGATGPQGSAGVQGATGLTGAQGPIGATGKMGLQGVQGRPGSPGMMGLTGPAGPTGPSGPTGPTGPVGPAGANSYVIHFYAGTVNLHGKSHGAARSSCPAGETPIAASCGYQAETELQDQTDVVLNYEGLDVNDRNKSLCLINNSSSGSRNLNIGISCLASSTGTSAAQVVKSCTYDPDTQTPCTEADATVFDPTVDKAEALARVKALNAAGPTPSPTGDTQKVKRSVTLWFRQ